MVKVATGRVVTGTDSSDALGRSILVAIQNFPSSSGSEVRNRTCGSVLYRTFMSMFWLINSVEITHDNQAASSDAVRCTIADIVRARATVTGSIPVIGGTSERGKKEKDRKE